MTHHFFNSAADENCELLKKEEGIKELEDFIRQIDEEPSDSASKSDIKAETKDFATRTLKILKDFKTEETQNQ